MLRQTLFGGAVLVAASALLVGWSPSAPSIQPVSGRNNTVLFLVNSEPGLSNIYVATASALLEKHPHIQIHFASFPKLGSQLKRVSAHGLKISKARPIEFHQLSGPSYTACVHASGRSMQTTVGPPGIAGIKQLCRDMQFWISPWSGEEHLGLYREIKDVISQVNPAVVVLDTIFRPAIDATRDSNWHHVMMSPNTVIDNFPMDQPWGGMFWKYPAMGSGLPFPVPWRNIPENIYLNIRFIYSVLFMPDVKTKQDFLRSQGLKDPINFYGLHRPDVLWLTQTLPEASRPVEVVPVNVTCTGPISLSLGTVAEQDKDLARWLASAPTILINLGSGFMWLESHATVMAQAIAHVLTKTPNVQILWKYRNEEDGLRGYNVSFTPYGDDFKVPILPFLENGRLKMERWLAADPTSLLESGHIIASVHHGGAGCYHEAVGTGVPQVILPQWVDLYNYAQMVEDLDIGAWGCRETSPTWTPECLQDAILKIVDGDAASISIKQNAARLGKISQSDPGRYVAARAIAKIAGSGSY